MNVTKYLPPLRALVDIGPQISECINPNMLAALFSLLGKVALAYLLEILSLMAKEHKGAAPELSSRKRSRETTTIRQRSRSGNDAVRKHKREAEE